MSNIYGPGHNAGVDDVRGYPHNSYWNQHAQGDAANQYAVPGSQGASASNAPTNPALNPYSSGKRYSQQVDPAPDGSTNILSIFALVGALIFPPFGVFLGQAALRQIKKTNQGGRGMALAGTILGYVSCAIVLVTIAILIVTGIPNFFDN